VAAWHEGEVASGPLMGRGVVLLGHGTKDAEGMAEFLAYARAVGERSGDAVSAGVLEYPSAELPPIQTAFDLSAEAGLDELVVLPALLFFAGHTRDDVPAEVEQAQARHPQLRIAVAGPLGTDERLLAAIEDRVAPFEPDGQTAVLLVGRGSLNSEANADLHKTARMLWDRNGYGWVEAAYVSLVPPDVAAGIERCVRLGAKRVLVMPYFLNTGVLVKRIARQARAWQGPAEVGVAGHLGLHPLIVALLQERLDQARSGVCPCQAAAGCRIPSLRCARGTECLLPV
jgi:sirohydrochlorin cobaltochelatase